MAHRSAGIDDGLHRPVLLFPASEESPAIALFAPRGSPSLLHRGGHARTRWAGSPARMIAYVERSWLEALNAAIIYR